LSTRQNCLTCKTNIKTHYLSIFFILINSIYLPSCSSSKKEEILLKTYPLDSLENIIEPKHLEFDKDNSSDNNGSVKITASAPITIKLFDNYNPDIEETQLLYQAKLKTENLEGKVYLEMWCVFRGKGEFFSRALPSLISGTKDWTEQTTYFFLQKGENPTEVKLNLVIEGTGIVWLDDIRIKNKPLK
jgi:hypothetical protein